MPSGSQSNEPRPPRTAVECGFLGVKILAVCCLLNFIQVVPGLFAAKVTWQEVVQFPLQVFGIGFSAGYVTGLLAPLSRFGHKGHFIMGAACANVYLLACFTMFEPVALLNARWQSVVGLAFAATIMGGPFGILLAEDVAETADTSNTESDE
jgi:hypothetical protein